MRSTLTAGFAVVAALAWPVAAHAAIAVNWYSQQETPSKASAGASVEASSQAPGASGRPSAPASTPVAVSEASGEGSSDEASSDTKPSPPNPYPTISSSSPKLHNPHPEGPRSFWYTAEGHSCIYVPTSNGICFTVTTPAAGTAEPSAPPVNPAVLAEAAASRLALGPGRIQASPKAEGLTGAASWFWIEPAAGARSASVSLRGERVTVSASEATVRWSFGDGSSLTGGPGVPYQAGAAPAGAIRHVYQTRCLPGDAGRDPYVLSSCGPDGYTVSATVEWSIGYTASGPVGGGGALPSRSTSTSIAYPVSEARAFLTGAGGHG